MTYSGPADEAKYEVAQSFLTKDKRIAEIAAALGFAEPSAFIRARRPPGGGRRGAGAEGAPARRSIS